MFGISTVKLAIIGSVALAVVTTSALAFRHYTSLLETVTVLQTDNASLQSAVKLQYDAIAAQKDAMVEWQTAQNTLISRVSELATVANEAAQETRRLNDIFSKHDLSKLAIRKPGLIEIRINDGTANSFRMLECASGSGDPDCTPGDN